MFDQGAAGTSCHNSQNEALLPPLNEGKRQASPPSHEHPEAPPSHRQNLMGADMPVAPATLPETGPAHPPLGPGANPLAAEATDLRLPATPVYVAGDRTASRESETSAYARDEDDAATTASERQRREESEEREDGQRELAARLNKQRCDGYLDTIATVLGLNYRNGEDQKVEVVMRKLEKIIDDMNVV